MTGVLIQLAIPLVLILAAAGGRVAHRRRGAHIERRRADVAHITLSPVPPFPDSTSRVTASSS